MLVYSVSQDPSEIIQMQICCSKNIYSNYQCWKQLCCLILEKPQYCFSGFFMKRNSKEQLLFETEIFCLCWKKHFFQTKKILTHTHTHTHTHTQACVYYLKSTICKKHKDVANVNNSKSIISKAWFQWGCCLRIQLPM